MWSARREDVSKKACGVRVHVRKNKSQKGTLPTARYCKCVNDAVTD